MGGSGKGLVFENWRGIKDDSLSEGLSDWVGSAVTPEIWNMGSAERARIR